MLSFGVFGYQIYSAVQDISFFINVNEHHFETVKAIFPTIPSRFCDKFQRNRTKRMVTIAVTHSQNLFRPK